MEKKIWVVSPVFYVASVALAVMACVSLPFSLPLFFVLFYIIICAELLRSSEKKRLLSFRRELQQSKHRNFCQFP